MKIVNKNIKRPYPLPTHCRHARPLKQQQQKKKKKKRGENPVYYMNEFYFCGFYRCVNFGESLINWVKPEGLYV